MSISEDWMDARSFNNLAEPACTPSIILTQDASIHGGGTAIYQRIQNGFGKILRVLLSHYRFWLHFCLRMLRALDPCYVHIDKKKSAFVCFSNERVARFFLAKGLYDTKIWISINDARNGFTINDVHHVTDMDSKVKAMFKLIEEDHGFFLRRGEMYYKKRRANEIGRRVLPSLSCFSEKITITPEEHSVGAQ
ncbi:hypothetical protein IFM89_034124 [Coptis chinensis]|uniref:Uncharacterized protein n=1 Tax=Coptis chinensis TaxID=261450 RepID=A0A835I993_9MAGN|nr:hypothetical protein IFM89_034124 [Coptis chinensis]